MNVFFYLQTGNDTVTEENIKELRETYLIENCKEVYMLRECKNKITNKNVYYYNDLFFNFDTIKEVLLKFEYIIYLDDTWIVKENQYNDDVQKSLRILNKTIFEQVIFGDFSARGKIVKVCDILIKIPLYEFDVLDEPYIVFDKIKTIFNEKNQKNPYEKINNPPLNYDEYLMNKLCNLTNFVLKPGVFKTKFLLEKSSLIKNPYLEDKYSLMLEKKDFKTCYLDNQEIKKEEFIPIISNSSGNNITLVTGYFKFKKRAKKRGVSKDYDYLESSIPTLNIDHYMVIFVTEETIDHVEKIRKQVNLLHKTKIITVKESDLYQYENIDKLNELMKKNIPPYDSKYQILAVNSRYKLIKQAIEMNIFNTDYYGWIDFGISHIVDIPKNFKVVYSNHEKIRLGWIARKKCNKNFLIFNHKALGGGFFIGHKEIIRIFIDLHDYEFNKLSQMGYCINDDKLLFLMYEKYPNLFDVYCSGYANLANRINIR